MAVTPGMCFIVLAVALIYVVGDVSCIRIRVPCDTYKITTKTQTAYVAQNDMWGIYKIDYTRKCGNKAVYKHTKKDRYLYLNSKGMWCVADNESLSGSGDDTCQSSCNAVNTWKPAKTSPNVTGWRIYDKNIPGWFEDSGMTVSCICSLIEVTSCNERTHVEVPDIMGRYMSLTTQLCNNKVIYKHVFNERYIYVDESGKWMISNENELYGVNRSKSCTRFGYAYNPGKPVKEMPGKKGWKFYMPDAKKWVEDPHLEVKCG